MHQCGGKKVLNNVKELLKGKEDTREINVQLTRWCNYQCSYCIQGNHVIYALKDNKYYEDLAAGFREKLNEIDKQYPVPYEKFEVMGGEIGTLDLVPIVSKLIGPKTIRLNITTNLSGSVNTLNDVQDFCDSHNIEFFLICSFHEEFTTLDRFFEKVDALKAHHVNVQTEFVLHDENHEVCKAYIEAAKAHNISNHKVNLKREQGSKYAAGERTKPYCTEKSVEFINTLGLNTHKNVIRATFDDGSVEKLSREYFTNSNAKGTCDFNGTFYCKERSRMVRMSERGVWFACGGLEQDMLCNKKTGCALCGNLHLVRKE